MLFLSVRLILKMIVIEVAGGINKKTILEMKYLLHYDVKPTIVSMVPSKNQPQNFFKKYFIYLFIF